MSIEQTKYELQNILSGESSSSYDALIQAVASYLRSGSKTSPMAEEKHQNKTKETEQLIDFANKSNLFIENINEDDYISSGAEQRVYIKNSKSVIKLNDAIYYASWEDYFNNLHDENVLTNEGILYFIDTVFYIKPEIFWDNFTQ